MATLFGLGGIGIFAVYERQFLGPMFFVGLALIFQVYGPAIDVVLHPIHTAEYTGGIEWAALAMRMITTWLIFVFVGYLLADRYLDEYPQKDEGTADWWRIDRATAVATAFVGVGTVSFLIFLLTAETAAPGAGGISAKRVAPTGFINLGMNVGIVGGLILAAGYLSSTVDYTYREYVPMALGFLIAVSYGVYASTRLIIFLPLTATAVMVYYTYGRPRLGVIIVGVIGTLVFMGVLLLLRSRGPGVNLAALLEPGEIVLSVIGAKRGGLPVVGEMLKQRAALSAPLLGLSYIDWVLRLVPGIIFPYESLSLGRRIAPLLYGIYTGSPPTIVGELFLNFRIWGIIPGGIVFGGICNRLANWARSQRATPPHLLGVSVVLTIGLFLSVYSSIGIAGFRLFMWGIPLAIATVYIATPAMRDDSVPIWIRSSAVMQLGAVFVRGWEHSRTRRVYRRAISEIKGFEIFVEGD